jgi:GDP-D-mannose 3',5'-epimerase
LVKFLKREGFWVRAINVKFLEFSETEADDFIIADLRGAENCRDAVDRRFDEVNDGTILAQIPFRARL